MYNVAPWLVALFILGAGISASGNMLPEQAPPRTEPPPPRELVNLTRGIRFDPPLKCLAVSPSDPDIIYVGTEKGYIYVSKDGGKSWQENRVRVSRGRFLGTMRATGPPVIDWKSSWGHLGTRLDLDDKLVPSGVLEFRQPLFADESPLPTEVQGYVRSIYDEGLDNPSPSLLARMSGASTRLGVGLRPGAKWLTIRLRQKRQWQVGINIKQTLSLVAYPPTSIKWLDVNPEDPNDVFAATKEGLLRSRDGGRSWPTVFSGSTRWERMMYCVKRNPHDPRQIFVGTHAGLMVSTDDGENFYRITDQRLAQMVIRVIVFHPEDPDIIYVGTQGNGMFVSTDGGKNFKWVFVRPWPAQNFVYRVAVDPGNRDRLMIATMDGVFVSENGGRTFERTGGLLFTGQLSYGLSSTGRPGHFLLATWQDIWETLDGGKSWRIVYYGPTEWTIEWLHIAPSTPGVIWLLTYAEILKLQPRRQRTISPRLMARFRRLAAREPSVSDTARIALRRAGIDRSQRNAYRRRARWRALVPRIEVGAWRQDVNSTSARRHRPFLSGDPLPIVFENEHFMDDWIFFAMAYWDLGNLVFSMYEAPVDRYFLENNMVFHAMRLGVIDMYLERRRLQIEAMLEPDAAARTVLLRNLRIEELTAHLNYLTGGVFEPFEAF